MVNLFLFPLSPFLELGGYHLQYLHTSLEVSDHLMRERGWRGRMWNGQVDGWMNGGMKSGNRLGKSKQREITNQC